MAEDSAEPEDLEQADSEAVRDRVPADSAVGDSVAPAADSEVVRDQVPADLAGAALVAPGAASVEAVPDSAVSVADLAAAPVSADLAAARVQAGSGQADWAGSASEAPVPQAWAVIAFQPPAAVN